MHAQRAHRTQGGVIPLRSFCQVLEEIQEAADTAYFHQKLLAIFRSPSYIVEVGNHGPGELQDGDDAGRYTQWIGHDELTVALIRKF